MLVANVQPAPRERSALPGLLRALIVRPIKYLPQVLVLARPVQTDKVLHLQVPEFSRNYLVITSPLTRRAHLRVRLSAPMVNSMSVASVQHALLEHLVLPVLLLVPIVRPIKSLLPVLVLAQPVLTDKAPHLYALLFF